MDLLKRVFANVVQTIVPDSFINRNNVRKRSAENFEPELTDDEEVSDNYYLRRKRMKSNFDSPRASTSMRVLFEKNPSREQLPLQRSRNAPTGDTDDDVICINGSGQASLSSPKATVCFPSNFKKNGSLLAGKREMKSKNRKPRTPLFERFKRNGFMYSSSAAAYTRADTVRIDERNEYMKMVNDLRKFGTSFATSLRNFSSSTIHRTGHAPLVQSKTSVPDLIAKQSSWFNMPNVAYNGPLEKVTIQSSLPLNFTEEKIEPIPAESPKEDKVIETIDISQDSGGSSSSSSGVITSTPVRNSIRTPSRSNSRTSSALDALQDQIRSVLDRSFGTIEHPIEIEDNEDEQEVLEVKNENDDDVQIMSPSILKRQPINSLALDLKSSPYVSDSWLVQQRANRVESRNEREQKIEREKKKLDILKNESTLDQDLAQEIRRNLTLTDIIILEEKTEEKLPEIDESMLAVIHRARAHGRGLTEVITTTPNSIQITKSDIKSLGTMQWLNDNIINSYLDMIALRSKTAGKWPSVYVFTTFFYPKYLNEGYSNILKRWTRRVDIFSYDLLIFPIHLGIHWCLAAADLRIKTIKYYDSLGGKNFQCVKALLQYLGKEHQERKKTSLNEIDWKTEIVQDIPMQQNGSDCGMFACKFAEYLSRDADLTFKQEDMNYYRERMIYEIITQDLLYP